MQGIVGVKKHQTFAFRRIYTAVACCAKPLVRLVYDAYAAVGGSIRVAHLRGVVVGTVIDKNHFPIGKCLSQNAIDTPFNGAFDTKDGYDDRDFHVTKVVKRFV